MQSKLDAVPEGRGKKGPEKRARAQQQLLNEILGVQEETKKFRDPADLLK